ncbi:hypothetical protein K4K57_006975 [Colletotrichum sp. SAR 10_99]|nr:hypothetical protein K4K55_000873 [Colletotrichum sp. SAR 10_96]KAJ5017933.1 hypothetical protein K4K57_006975 [Colletotrichum sp. SAR 10_99]
MAARSSPLARLESNSDEGSVKRKRRCCGLPLWAFILIVVIVLGIIAAAIIVPLEFFVFRKNRTGSTPTTEPALGQCQNQLKCENGGTNVISQNVCSCICTNGFTGQTCTVAGATGCTTTTITGTASNFNNVTLGQAIPRLLQQAQTNFTVTLDGTDILAKFNTESLSCIAQNSLVTFDGRSTRQGTTNSQEVVANVGVNADNIPIQIITLLPGQATTITFNFIETGAVIGPSGDILDHVGYYPYDAHADDNQLELDGSSHDAYNPASNLGAADDNFNATDDNIDTGASGSLGTCIPITVAHAYVQRHGRDS